MRPLYWCVALAATALTATFATAQQQRVPAGNPLSRSETAPSFFRAFPTGPLDSRSPNTNPMARPGAHFGSVTPVPEPSEWLMMLAGLGLVGAIVRRGARRS
ncbi:MAG TPA: PEPxxWA-CTERM sorting domain-containing protein [Usitatibacter sp.]|jgi:hypothetical protein|nr:PEPxxWA-CTERM sorting domain-containing protein [Usitatibacter sp.]